MVFYKYNKRWFLIPKCCKILIVLFAILTFTMLCTFLSNYNLKYVLNNVEVTTNKQSENTKSNLILSAKDLISNRELRVRLLTAKAERLEKRIKMSRSIVLNSKPIFRPNYNVHIFYYGWYANKEIDGYYKHWNHSYLPNWKKDNQKIFPTGYHEPIINDIGSNFYPLLDCYSSKDPKIIKAHMKLLKETGIGVIVLSWAPAKFVDSPNEIMPLLFKYAQKFKLKVALHIEPYPDRNPINLFQHLHNFMMEYGSHPALYKVNKPLHSKKVPVFYVYDSYLIPAIAWKELLSVKGNLSVRGTNMDGIFIGLLVDVQHRYHIKKSHFDGFYTYFSANSFSYGSTWKNWKSLSKYAVQNGLIFIPSVGPGYIDTQVRPWNSKNTRHRRHGQYYDVAWRTAINSGVNYVSITSFNEWHEGTQIEPAVQKEIPGFTYANYEPDGSYFYMNLTKWWVEQFNKALIKNT